MVKQCRNCTYVDLKQKSYVRELENEMPTDNFEERERVGKDNKDPYQIFTKLITSVHACTYM